MTQTVNPNLTEQLKYLTVQGFMKATGLSQTVVYRLIREGALNTFKVTQNSIVRIPASEIEKFQGIERCARGRKRGSKNVASKNKVITQMEPIKFPLPMHAMLSEFKDLQLALCRFCNSLKMAAIDLSLEC